MTLDEIKGKLTKIEGGSDIYEAVASLVTDEKTKGMEEKRKADAEAKNLRQKYKKPLEELGLDLEADIAEQIKAYKTKATTADALAQEKTKATGELAEWQKRFGELETQFAEIKKANEEKEHKLRTTHLRQELGKALGEDIYAKDAVITAWIAEGRVQLDGESIIFKEGDKSLALADGVKLAKEKGLVDLKVTQKPGAGPGGQGAGTKETTDAMIAKVASWRS